MSRFDYRIFRDKVDGLVRSKRGNAEFACPVCSHNQWLGGNLELQVSGKLWEDGEDADPQDVTFPVAPLICGHCRFLLLFPSKFYSDQSESDNDARSG